ncbi:two-component sensor histidine kinase [Alteromonas sediminis]|uniref:histidine kinase n=1 Tax=Alteromonas sediminis TaxID=2259342 RepID=A0A3N5Y897_9ALTE|nr:ATP-binding protein [Alteromonas sediminis]RPJ67229.1 two-component sensor histidine kinase [Alteromonas sediminis]
MTSPEEELELLRRKIAREIKARELAESQLERYSREVYHTNQSLKENLQRVEKRSFELEFLHNASGMVNSDLSITGLLKSITSYIAKFVAANAGGFYLYSDLSIQEVEEALVWTKEEQWHHDDKLVSLIKAHVQIKNTQDIPQWIIAPLEQPELENPLSTWLIYKTYTLDKRSTVVLAFLCGDQSIQEETLYVLDTIHDHLSSGLKRRLADKRIQRRNKQLVDTIATLETTQQQLVQSEKMASLGILAAGVAHEINNPIGYIKSNLEILGEYQVTFSELLIEISSLVKANTLNYDLLQQLYEKYDVTFLIEDAADILQTNIDGIKRVSDIVKELKTYSHAGENIQSLISIKDCIQSALKVAGNALKYLHQVEAGLPDNLPKIIGNAGQLQQVFINLFVNAAHAMPKGGELLIQSEVNAEQKTLSIFVSDTGVGMDAEQQKKLFLPFYTTKPVGQGTGLGLSVSMAILEAHNVKVQVKSDVGLGTTFKLTFPLPQ